jgi:hypothetical protein
MLRNKIRKLIGRSYPLSIPQESHSLKLEAEIPNPPTFDLRPSSPSKSFTFLNQSHTFEKSIDWNFKKYGKLWAYNLNYFDYLHQPGIGKEKGLELIREFIDQLESNREGLEPYPISLRGINWIKFLTNHDISDKEIDFSLYAQYQILLDNLEYHLLGNHLLENGCSLLFGACYFKDEGLWKSANRILKEQLEEQILSDGGHFERSTMYHCILLERLLDCYNLLVNNEAVWDDELLKKQLRKKISKMLGWLNVMTVHKQGTTDDRDQPSLISQLPLLNDAAEGIAANLSELFRYANRLEVEPEGIALGESGYRRYSVGKIDLICDVGDMGPDYQPGHAHSDTFSFVLYHCHEPILIDPGISTYEKNERRHLERSTKFHNTVQLGDLEQSKIWAGFRVARRAHVFDISENKEKVEKIILSALHDGYKNYGIIHTRSWEMDKSKNQILIKDDLNGETEEKGFFRLYFHPKWRGRIYTSNDYLKVGKLIFLFSGISHLQKDTYDMPNGYNQFVQSERITISFNKKMTTTIKEI